MTICKAVWHVHDWIRLVKNGANRLFELAWTSIRKKVGVLTRIFFQLLFNSAKIVNMGGKMPNSGPGFWHVSHHIGGSIGDRSITGKFFLSEPILPGLGVIYAPILAKDLTKKSASYRAERAPQMDPSPWMQKCAPKMSCFLEYRFCFLSGRTAISMDARVLAPKPA